MMEEKYLPMPACKIPWDQGVTNRCVSYALTMAARLKLYGLTRKWIDLDPRELYDRSGASGGASVSVLAELAGRIGFYNSAGGCRVKMGAYRRISGYDAICAEIDAGNPVAIAINVDKSVGRRKGGVEPMYPRGTVSGHAVCVVGYKQIDGRRHLALKNSYGDPLGNGGIVYISDGRLIREAVALTATGTAILRKAQIIRLTAGGKAADVDGKVVAMPAAPYIKRGRLLVPVRAVADALGCTVTWDAASGTATLASEEGVLALATHSPVMQTGGKPVGMDAAPEIVGSGTMMIPVRYIAEALHCKVAWDALTRTATITAI